MKRNKSAQSVAEFALVAAFIAFIGVIVISPLVFKVSDKLKQSAPVQNNANSTSAATVGGGASP